MTPEITYNKGVIEFSAIEFSDILKHGMGDIATPSRVYLMMKYRILNPIRCPRTHNPTLRPDDLLPAYCAIWLKVKGNITHWETVARLMGNNAEVMQNSKEIRSTPEWKNIIDKLTQYDGVDIKDYPNIAPVLKK